MTARLSALRQWLAHRHSLDAARLVLESIADDASFRRYFRLRLPQPGGTRVVMDAPPEHEPSRSFVAIALAWASAGLPVPGIHAADLSRGFLELDDLGDTLLRRRLNDAAPAVQDALIDDAMALSVRIASQPSAALPPYDRRRLAFELGLFPEWALTRWLGIAAPACFTAVCERLIQRLLDQPRLTTHRDYHPGNLLVGTDDELAVIDFQGAWAGPLGYDPASLLRDRNPPWPIARQHAWFATHQALALEAGLSAERSTERHLCWIAEASAQRSIKVLGLFCRLAQRDGKPGYLLGHQRHFFAHLRQAMGELTSAGGADAPLWRAFDEWLDGEFEPRMRAQLDAMAGAAQ
ncbi:aminoglycoside phosphotransferase family protein [Halotalea alkalilenta]|uniref:Aminoglycoside phosphotransferase domain-containing protein n=1 Tax=Halotalea alkalilenta TaxID=376489 RepID=A0A172YH07_9GAMM|nr:phosphotransferase [Halotalea alkalilenta]ANF58551.1 hypothetical protein A5892_14605 [Halotalea alkalilenta]